MARLRIEDARFAFAGRPAGRADDVLDGVDLAVEGGEIVAVVGPNGAGKTTLLRVASGWLVPSGGRVLVDGDDLARLSRREAARRLAGVPVGGTSEFPFTVREAVALGRHPWRSAFGGLSATDVERIEAALEAAELADLVDRPLPRLSSGERQRVAIARCLAHDASVFLLDEPTSHLDLGRRVRMLERFRRAAKAEGKAVLVALHDLNLAALVADRLVLLVAGRVVADGVPSEVLDEERVHVAFGARVAVHRHPERGVPVIVALGEPGARS